MEEVARALILAGVVPLWIVAGFADWACHRRTSIETTGGLPENLFHWALFAEMAAPVLAVLFLEVNAAVLAIVLAGFAVHELTVWIELRYAVARREVSPVEQMVHSFMELLALVLGGILAMQVFSEPGGMEWGLHWKAQPWPAEALLALAAAIVAFNVVPLAEEAWRCRRARSA